MLVALLLNDVVLEPGEAMYVAPGVVHAHGSGLAVEIMAASDNVLRAGLTPKHRDVEELLADHRLHARAAPGRWPPSEHAAGVRALHDRRPRSSSCWSAGRRCRELPATGPRILLALDAEVEVARRRTRTAAGPRGRAVFVEHDDGPVTVTGAGVGGPRRRTAASA